MKEVQYDELRRTLGKISSSIGRIKNKFLIEHVEVTEYQWDILMGNQDFKKQAEIGNANIGGYKILRGERFKVHKKSAV